MEQSAFRDFKWSITGDWQNIYHRIQSQVGVWLMDQWKYFNSNSQGDISITVEKPVIKTVPCTPVVTCTHFDENEGLLSGVKE